MHDMYNIKITNEIYAFMKHWP